MPLTREEQAALWNAYKREEEVKAGVGWAQHADNPTSSSWSSPSADGTKREPAKVSTWSAAPAKPDPRSSNWTTWAHSNGDTANGPAESTESPPWGSPRTSGSGRSSSNTYSRVRPQNPLEGYENTVPPPKTMYREPVTPRNSLNSAFSNSWGRAADSSWTTNGYSPSLTSSTSSWPELSPAKSDMAVKLDFRDRATYKSPSREERRQGGTSPTASISTRPSSSPNWGTPNNANLPAGRGRRWSKSRESAVFSSDWNAASIGSRVPTLDGNTTPSGSDKPDEISSTTTKWTFAQQWSSRPASSSVSTTSEPARGEANRLVAPRTTENTPSPKPEKFDTLWELNTMTSANPESPALPRMRELSTFVPPERKAALSSLKNKIYSRRAIQPKFDWELLIEKDISVVVRSGVCRVVLDLERCEGSQSMQMDLSYNLPADTEMLKLLVREPSREKLPDLRTLIEKHDPAALSAVRIDSHLEQAVQYVYNHCKLGAADAAALSLEPDHATLFEYVNALADVPRTRATIARAIPSIRKMLHEQAPEVSQLPVWHARRLAFDAADKLAQRYESGQIVPRVERLPQTLCGDRSLGIPAFTMLSMD